MIGGQDEAHRRIISRLLRRQSSGLDLYPPDGCEPSLQDQTGGRTFKLGKLKSKEQAGDECKHSGQMSFSQLVGQALETPG